MKTIPAVEFEARCLALLTEVAENRETLVVTKDGKPVAQVVSYTIEAGVNPLKDSVLFETDLVSPIDEHWNVNT